MIREITPENGAYGAAQTRHNAVEQANLGAAHGHTGGFQFLGSTKTQHGLQVGPGPLPVGAAEKRRHPVAHTVGHEGASPGGDGVVTEGAQGPQLAEGLGKAYRCHGGRKTGQAPAWLPHREPQHAGQNDAGESHHKECLAPGQGVGNPSSQPVAGQGADIEPRGVDSQGAAPLFLFVVIRQHGMGRRTAPRFTEAHPQSGQQQMDKAAGKAAEGGKATPQGQGYGNDRLAAGQVRDAGHRNSGNAIHQGKGQTGEHTQLGIGQAKVSLDRLLQDIEDLAVDEIENIHDHQNGQCIAPVFTGLFHRVDQANGHRQGFYLTPAGHRG